VLDLCDCERQVKDLEVGPWPRSAPWQESATALQDRIWASFWATAEERNRAHVLLVRLERLIAAGTIAPRMWVRG
jgi:hypothetical protein